MGKTLFYVNNLFVSVFFLKHLVLNSYIYLHRMTSYSYYSFMLSWMNDFEVSQPGIAHIVWVCILNHESVLHGGGLFFLIIEVCNRNTSINPKNLMGIGLLLHHIIISNCSTFALTAKNRVFFLPSIGSMDCLEKFVPVIFILFI